ncbi:MAG: NAD-dependent protein deacylase [Desulfurococcales archaeon]|nr:NAD-dependent protein deacylase [Desulfurococcales archaeon]
MIEEAIKILTKSRHAIALTGAGISTASGIPDFRGPKGLWKRVSEDLFYLDTFLNNPEKAWNALMELTKLDGIKPNPAHYSLATLERIGIIKAVITQNIDGLHQKAGSRNVIELHGNLKWTICLRCGYREEFEKSVSRFNITRSVPRCPKCNFPLKPSIVLFGEQLPLREMSEAFRLARISDLILILGSSLEVSPANTIPILVKENNGYVIIINHGKTMLDHIADIKINGRVEEIMPRICMRVLKELGYELKC